ncbi:hypothetical protein WN48_07295 [Eufriesea mexicana]|uniref:Uncharacterized protein n=1 Tax=Eufriesea mexicana TaxID=516756 RepID=A0A310SX30_9HYME|nr:hypothetical protein WN48_07295 [Eufriesea mexicana]
MKRAEKAPCRNDRGGVESGRQHERTRKKTVGKAKRQSERGQAERRDEKLDLQICPDYYEIARLPSRDAQPVAAASRGASATGYKYPERSTLPNSLPLYSSRPGRPPKRASVGLSLAASHLAAATGHHPQHSLKKHRMDNGDYYENGHLDVPRMEKSPLLANGYNHPPTHLSHMQFMQLGGHPGAGHTAILSPASLPHHLQAQAQARAEQGLKVNPNMSNMEALARSGTVWENCRAAYEDIVKHLERPSTPPLWPIRIHPPESILTLFPVCFAACRLREERGDAERALALDQKPRDLSSHNGSSNGHSPVLNLSKTAGSGSVGEHSGSEAEASHRSQDDEEEDDNLSEDLDDDNEKDEGTCYFQPIRVPGASLPAITRSSRSACLVSSRDTENSPFFRGTTLALGRLLRSDVSTVVEQRAAHWSGSGYPPRQAVYYRARDPSKLNSRSPGEAGKAGKAEEARKRSRGVGVGVGGRRRYADGRVSEDGGA